MVFLTRAMFSFLFVTETKCSSMKKKFANPHNLALTALSARLQKINLVLRGESRIKQALSTGLTTFEFSLICYH